MSKRRTHDEWLQVIQACKASGYPDAEWCKLNGIPLSTFYTKLKLARQKSEVLEVAKPIIQQKQEVVEVNFQPEPPSFAKDVDKEPALRLSMNGISVEIFNTAAKETIENTLYALRRLC